MITNIKFHVITLKKSDERREYMKKLLTTNKIPFVIYKFDKHKNPALGAFISHLKLYKMAKKKKLPYLAILEDNVTIFNKLNKDSFKEIESFINSSTIWNQLYIGGSIDPSFNKVEEIQNYNGRIWKDFNNLHGTNAYIISKSHYTNILSDPDIKKLFKDYYANPLMKTVAFDIFIRKYDNRFIHKPFILPHRSVGSTINKHLDFVRKIYFNKTVVKICEFLFFHNWQIKTFGIFFSIFIIIIIVVIIYIILKLVKKI
jgi:hypothetical protein